MIAIPAAAKSFFSNLREKRGQGDQSSCGWYESSMDLLNGLEVREHAVDAKVLADWASLGKAPAITKQP